jgi:hypothetical protein
MVADRAAAHRDRVNSGDVLMELRSELAIVACLLAAPAAGAELYRCVAADGAVSYQDAPCAGGSTLSKTIPVSVADDKARERKPIKSRAGTGRSAKTGRPKESAADGRTRQRAACAKARKERDTKLERLGLNRTFEQLRAMDDQVEVVCKGL